MQSSPNTWLFRYAQFVVFVTLCLIFLGGMVTTKGAGLAVPDWPLSFHSFNPPGWWLKSDVRLEHSHRLLASFLGLLTTILAVLVWKFESRVWVKWLGLGAFIGVCLQGILGGLRVTNVSTTLAMVHGCVGQAFLCLLVFLTLVLSPNWENEQWLYQGTHLCFIRRISWVLVGAVYIQLIIGALVRHLHAGLAIPDFPLSYGHIIPPMHSQLIDLHFTHRAWALVITCIFLVTFVSIFSSPHRDVRLMTPALFLLGFICLQIVLGAHIIWLARPPVTTTLHVVNGALVLISALVLAVRASRLKQAATVNGSRHTTMEPATV